MSKNEVNLPEVLFEFVIQGNFVKVIAVDPITGTEIAIVGDARASKKVLETLATIKLLMVLKKKNKEETGRDESQENLY